MSTTESVRRADDPVERFMEHVELPDDRDQCWNWASGKNGKGYGRFKFRGTTRLAHRIGYEFLVGEVPDGLFVLHRCDNPSCVNPFHLFLGTIADNAADMVSKGRQKNGPASPARVRGNI